VTGAVYLLDKPAGETSRSASGRTAAALGFRKYGHAGTLDPAASGVLPVLLGRATRLSSILSGLRKTYSFDLVTGVQTDTGDAQGRIVGGSYTLVETGEAELREVLAGLVGEIEQRVPAYSAVRVGGERAYKLARRGLEPSMPVRLVTLESLEIAGRSPGGVWRLRATVSAGTYIRALAVEIGERTGCGAHADRIVREAFGPFGLGECSSEPADPAALLTPVEALRGFPAIRLPDSEAARILNGNPVAWQAEGVFAVLDAPGGRLLAIARGDGAALRPTAVLETP
jgi:tRNA pseudouridine55 synthase